VKLFCTYVELLTGVAPPSETNPPEATTVLWLK